MASIYPDYVMGFAPYNHNGLDLVGDGNDVVSPVDGDYSMQYDSTFGLNGVTYAEGEAGIAYQSSHMAAAGVLNYIGLAMTSGITLSNSNGQYLLEGIQAGMVIGQMGDTGNASGAHVDYMVLQLSGNRYYANINLLNNKYLENLTSDELMRIQYGSGKNDDWVTMFSGLGNGYASPYHDPKIWENLRRAKLIPKYQTGQELNNLYWWYDRSYSITNRPDYVR